MRIATFKYPGYYTFTFCLKELKQQGLEADMSILGTTPKLIHLLCAKSLLPKEEETKIFDTKGGLENGSHYWRPAFESVSYKDMFPVYNVVPANF